MTDQATSETFDATQPDWWVCLCGNQPDRSGLYAVNPAGEWVLPTAESWPEGRYGCPDCGRVGRLEDRDPNTGKVPVIAHLTKEQREAPLPY